jgi:hypothetical protein
MARQYVESVALSKRPVAAAAAESTAQIPGDNLVSSVYAPSHNDPGVSSSDVTLMQGAEDEYGGLDLDSLYFLTPDSDWMAGMSSLDEFDPREHYGSIFL